MSQIIQIQQTTSKCQNGSIGLFVAIWIGREYKTVTSTAFLISQTELITCTHSVQDQFGKECTHFAFIPNPQLCQGKININIHPLTKQSIISTKYHPIWSDGIVTRQFLMIILKDPIENISNLFQLIGPSKLINHKIKIIGYANVQIKLNYKLSELQIINISKKELTDSQFEIRQKQLLILHQIPTDYGMSGSPIFVQYLEDNNEQWGIIGIHVRKSSKIGVKNMGFMFPNSKFHRINPIQFYQQQKDTKNTN